MHADAPAKEYLPALQKDTVAFVDPAGQAYPEVQLPEQDAVVRPVEAPYVPPGQLPLHEEVDRPCVAPYSPTGQAVHDAAPPVEYCPVGQMDAVGNVDPAGQAYPAVHGPVQAAVVRPVVAP